MDCCKPPENGCCPPPNRYVPGFSAWQEFTPVIPKMYWDVESQEQRMHNVCATLHKLVCYADLLADKIGINRADIDELQRLFKEFQESGFYDYYAEQIEQWINDNLGFLFTHLAKQVYFGLTLDGHFVAYIPESWQDIVFDTGMVYGLDTYGRLILRWDVDESEGNVNQRPEDWS